MKFNKPKIVSLIDYVIEVEGKYPYFQGQTFEIDNKEKTKCLVITADKDRAFLLGDTSVEGLKIGDTIQETKNHFISTPYSLFGKIININNEILVDSNNSNNKKDKLEENKNKSFIFNKAVTMEHREKLSSQLYTGILAIDLLNPIGFGQREAIIGDREVGKTHIALNTMINQLQRNTKCIYVSIGQKKRNVYNVYEVMEKHKLLDNLIIIDAPSTSSYQQFLAPYVAMSHAENLVDKHDVLIIFDDLTRHANIYREISLLINTPVGKEAFPGDMFFMHSSLLERSGKFIGKKSITCLPIIKSINNDITSLISSNVISITDGQIVLNSNLFAANKIPAIDLNLSVSRTGSSVQSKNVGKIAQEIKKIYYNYKKETELFILDNEWNKATSDLLFKGKAIEEIFTQKGFTSYSEKEVMILSKIISWSTLKTVEDTQQAMRFIKSIITHDKNGKLIFNRILSGKNYDNNLSKSYIETLLKQCLDHSNIKNKLAPELEMAKLSLAELEKLIENSKEAQYE